MTKSVFARLRTGELSKIALGSSAPGQQLHTVNSDNIISEQHVEVTVSHTYTHRALDTYTKSPSYTNAHPISYTKRHQCTYSNTDTHTPIHSVSHTHPHTISRSYSVSNIWPYTHIYTQYTYINYHKLIHIDLSPIYTSIIKR